MSRKSHQLLPWTSARRDCADKRFVQIGNSLLLDKAHFQKLSSRARLLYVCMVMESGGNRNFQFPRSAAMKYGFAESSYPRYIEELCKAEMIVKTASGRTTRTANSYEFAYNWKA